MKIIIAGDYYPSGRVKRIIESKDYASVFNDIIPIVKSSDYSIVNYESPVVLGNYAPIKKCGPNLSSTKNAVEAIRYAGFKMVTLANNHILDFGPEALRDTVKTCNEYEIDTVGVGNDLSEASKIFYKTINNKILAIINCCEHEFSIATANSAGANPLNPIQQYYKIKEAKENADYVLVIVHGGHEHFQLPSPRMVETYRFFVDAGADAVVNHHQHCFSGYEYYNGKPIFYGLGNFCFEREGKVNTLWNTGLLLELQFDDGQIQFNMYPYFQCNGSPTIKLMDDTSQFEKDISAINSIISDNSLLIEKCNKFYKSRKKAIKLIFEPYNNKILRKLYYLDILPSFYNKKKVIVENYINCESHRDILQFNI